MERINFDPEYVNLILEGEKTTTVRRGIKSYPVGRLVELTVNNSTVFALAKVKKVVVKRVKELTDEDARRDGFGNKSELIEALRRIYGGIRDDEFVTVVHFELAKRV
ncbi:MAG: ASCH domain-containing protein [Candidatus Methanomethylicota archaeon]|uniref:ASCH domain-containing protein n=1 Tax=Thermoproteota archaeon TaxID=2056631 RepID=A0A497EK38_9CREN|nr:MAG: ASCH domain-containing protein [Candidatus Verstraetearchaeota archaeon]